MRCTEDLVDSHYRIEMDDHSQEYSERSGTSTSVLERPETDEQEDRLMNDGDADRFAHYVSAEDLAQSRLTGYPVVALCGKIWVPTRLAEDYPVCSDCKRIYNSLSDLS